MSAFVHNSPDTLSLARKCELVGVSRASSYRLRRPAPKAQRDTHVRHKMQQIALEMSCYGYRRLTHELKRQGENVGERRVRRLMREDNLLCLRKRAFVATTDSDPALPTYPNLARDLALTRPDQLWRADTSEPVADRASRSVTYVHLQREFVYTAIVLDAFSRRVIGWAVERYLDTRLPLAALEQALASRHET